MQHQGAERKPKSWRVFQGKNFKTSFWRFNSLSIRVSQRKITQVETIYKLIKVISYISLTFSDWLLTPGYKFEKICLISWGRLLDMRRLQPTRSYAPRWLSIISFLVFLTRASGILIWKIQKRADRMTEWLHQTPDLPKTKITPWTSIVCEVDGFRARFLVLFCWWIVLKLSAGTTFSDKAFIHSFLWIVRSDAIWGQVREIAAYRVISDGLKMVIGVCPLRACA